MRATPSLDKKINQYLARLNNRQKEAVLTVVKTFAEEAPPEYDQDLKNELDNRFDDYKNGGKLVSEASVKKKIRRIITGKATK